MKRKSIIIIWWAAAFICLFPGITVNAFMLKGKEYCVVGFDERKTYNANAQVNIEMVYVQGNDTIKSFSIGKYEVTQGQWKAIMGENPSHFKDCDNCPVENVSWEDVQNFIRKLNAATGKTYRLPSDKEWEYAYRGGAKSKGYKYSGSNNINDVAWFDDNSGERTHPVGTKAPNELGIYDMSGNVQEWCRDILPMEMPHLFGSIPKTVLSRLIRGSGCINNCGGFNQDGRGFGETAIRRNNLGFRLVLP